MPNEEVQARVEALGRNYQPLEGVQLDMDVTNEFSGERILSTKGVTDADGQYRLAIKHDKEGYYIVKVTAKKENEEIGQDHAVFSIAAENKEFKDPAIRRDLLAKMSGVSGGRCFDLPVKDVEDKISLENPAVTKLVGNRRITLWDNGYIFIILLATASAEWWIRKRSGLS